MVAKSYQELEKLSEPYESNGKMYIKVRLKSGKEKEVRWYEEKEYSRMYNKTTTTTTSSDIISTSHLNQKDALGFNDGYITVFKGNTFPYLEYFRASESARFNALFGWYIPSTVEYPSSIPSDLEPIRIDWDLIKRDDVYMKTPDEVIKIIKDYMYPISEDEYFGEVGEEVTIEATVVKNIPMEGYYGMTYFHVFETDDGRQATWTTASKCWNTGERHTLKGRVKDRKTYLNAKEGRAVAQTVLTRCREV